MADTPAKLNHVSDQEAGIRRHRQGRGFWYCYPDGRKVCGKRQLQRIKALAIPPAWRDVWICTDTQGHIQVSARDAKGRKQYRYHPAWQEFRGRRKFSRLVEFAQALPALRRKVSRDLGKPGLPRSKVLASAIRLLEKSLVRVGHEEYLRDNNSYGLTTLQDRHIDIGGGRILLRFRGKGGKRQQVAVRDARLAGVLKACRDLPGPQLFQFVDRQGRRHSISANDINRYIRDATGCPISAKDFRTWAASCLAAAELQRRLAEGEENPLKASVEAVAAALGNTVTICRRYYIHPAIIAAYEDGSLSERLAMPEAAAAPEGLTQGEKAVLALIRSGQRGKH